MENDRTSHGFVAGDGEVRGGGEVGGNLFCFHNPVDVLTNPTLSRRMPEGIHIRRRRTQEFVLNLLALGRLWAQR